MHCAHCATPVPDGARFCHACGSQVSDAEGQAAVTASMDNSSFLHMESLLREDTKGEFEIDRMLGRGGMAVVYLAREVHLSRKVAIKVLPPELTFGHGVERFKREAKTAAALDHPNIIPIYRISSGGKLFWYAMKFLEGSALDQLLKERERFDLDETIRILTQVADALDYGHEHNVIHRDIKPANVMLDKRGRVVVTDFGIAKALTEGTLTASGSVIGTPYFMSPEQGMGKPVTGAADQYSVAVMAYRMLSGKVPFEGDSAIDILHKHCMVPAPALETLQPGLPRHVYLAVHRALEKTPERRFKSVTEFVEAIIHPTQHQIGERTSESEVATVVVPASVGVSASSPAISMPGVDSPATPTTPMPHVTPSSPVRRRAVPIAAAIVVVAATGIFMATRGGDDAGPGDDPVPADPQTQVDGGPGQPAEGAGDSTAAPATSGPTPPAAPTTGRLVVSNLPVGGSVRINNQRRNGTEFDLAPDTYAIEMRASGYQTQQRRVEVVAGFDVQVVFSRVLVQTPSTPAAQPPAARPPAQTNQPTYAWLRVGARPAGEIFIDGRSFGEGRTILERVTAGVPHQIQVRVGNASADTTVTLTAGDTTLVVLRARRP